MKEKIQQKIEEIISLIPENEKPDGKDKLKKLALERKLLEWYVDFEDYLEEIPEQKISGISISQNNSGDNSIQNIS